VAALLAGTVDGAIPVALDFQRANLVKDQWEQADKKPLYVVQAVQWRTMSFQFRPDKAKPSDLLDVRVRRALLYAIDRQSIVDTLFNGQSPVSDAYMPPDDYRWDWIKDGVLTYPFDQRQAQALLSDAGWRKDSAGSYVTSSSQHVSIAEWTTPDYATEISIIADNWKGIGLDSEQVNLSPGQAQDREYIATFPAVMTTTFPINFQYWIQRHLGSACSTDANRWTGNNRGCYQNPERDRVAEALNTAIDPAQQRPLYHGLAKIESEDLPALPLYFNTVVTIFRAGVTGVKGNTKPKTTATWNVSDWDVH
jgi:peptide/nickel transport system substrate-binding protein